MSETLNIVELIENNPITKLSCVYNSKLLTKIQSKFTDFEQQLFVSSFYCYLNCDTKKDFVIDLDDVWKWLGFSIKQKAKFLLEKNFVVNQDYINSLNLQVKQTPGTKGGHNKEIFMLSVKTFKSLCLKAGTKKADEIHDYYLKMEDILHEVIHEESDELKLQLENEKMKNENLNKQIDKMDIELDDQKIQTGLEKSKLREKTILEQFPPNTQCVYYGMIDNVSTDNEPLIKFGNSNNLRNRVNNHRNTYNNFRLVNAFKVDNKLEIETAIKINEVFNARLRSLTIIKKNYVELLSIEGLTIFEIDKTIHEIIKSIECTPENYKRLLEDNSSLRKQLDEKDNSICNQVLTIDNKRLTKENSIMIKKIKSLEQINKKYNSALSTFSPCSTPNNISLEIEQEYTPQIVCEKPNNIIVGMKKPFKQKDGFYHVGDNLYTKLFGSRQEVWDGVSYKTTGGLTKSDLIINHKGKIISICKSVTEKNYKRFEQVNLLRKHKFP
jgi:hypothetical protein